MQVRSLRKGSAAGRSDLSNTNSHESHSNLRFHRG
jgi:hypothetical protein